MGAFIPSSAFPPLSLPGCELQDERTDNLFLFHGVPSPGNTWIVWASQGRILETSIKREKKQKKKQKERKKKGGGEAESFSGMIIHLNDPSLLFN